MLCKRMALALLLPLSLAALLGVGCGGKDDNVQPPSPPVLGSEAGVTGLSITLGELAPAFSPNINRYTTTVGLLGEDSIQVTVTLKDPKAKLRVNGLDVASGAPTNVSLVNAVNTVSVLVTAEDGRTSNTVTLTVNKLPFNTRVWVLNGMGGVPVENTLLKLTDAKGNVLADNVPLPKEKNGEVIFGLDPAQKYNIYAKADFSAAACYANFDPAKEDTAALYCSNTSTSYYALEAPVIEEIAFGTANANDGGAGGWKIMPNTAYYVGTLANVAAVRVTAFTSNLNASTMYDSAYDEWDTTTRIAVPLRINIDNVASANAGGSTGAVGTTIGTRNTPVTVDGKVIGYRTVYRAATPAIQANIFNKEHFLSVMASDVIGNRTEQRVYLTITDSTNAVADDPDLTGIVPKLDWTQAQTFVGNGNFQGRPGAEVNAIDQPENYNGYAQVVTNFYALTATGAGLAIRGYEVWRSIGNEDNFVKIATVNYATTNATTNVYQFVDRTPSITLGDMYYMFRFFNGNPTNKGYSQFSPIMKTVVLPPFYVMLAPSHNLVSPKLWPTFKIAVSDPGVLAKGTFGQMRICLTVKYADNPYLFMLVPMLLSSDKLRTADQYDWAGTTPAYVATGFSYSSSSSALSGTITWQEAYDYKDVPDGEDDQGNPKTKRVYTPFVKVEADGTIVIDTDSANFQKYMENAVRAAHYSAGEAFLPGATYIWNIMGANAGVRWSSSSYPGRWTTTANTQAAYLGGKEINDHLPAGDANRNNFRGTSYGSGQIYGFGSPEGWFPIIIAADAE